MGDTSMRAPAAEPPQLWGPWDPWLDGPQLRKTCWTARQLYFLTPKMVYLESRRTHIGEFPAQWVEQHGAGWMQKLDAELSKLEIMDNNLSQTTVNGTQNSELAILRSRALRAKQIIELHDSAELTSQELARKRERLYIQQQRRRELFRRDMEKLQQHESGKVEEDEGVRPFVTYREPHYAVDSDSDSVASSFHSARQFHLSVPTSAKQTLKHSHAASSSSISVSALSTSSGGTFRSNRELKPKEHHHHKHLHHLHWGHYKGRKIHWNMRGQERKLQLLKRPIYNRHGLQVLDANGRPRQRSSSLKRTNTRRTQALPEIADSSYLPTSLSATPFDPPQSTEHSHWPSSFRHHHSHLRPHVHAHRKVYQGRFLVQERKTRQRSPTVNETLAPLETTLSTRWRECAVLARRTSNPLKPLILYFYDCLDSHRLVRKTHRRWNRSLRYKVTITPSLNMSVFNPLDFTVALWRPRKFDLKARERQRRRRQRLRRRNLRRYSKYLNSVYPNKQDRAKVLGERCRKWLGANKLRTLRNRNTSNPGRAEEPEPEHYGDSNKNTHILLIHAVKLPDIMDLAYLIANAIGTTKQLLAPAGLKVEIPSLDATACVAIRGNRDEKAHLAAMAALADQPLHSGLISYAELLQPAVSSSADLQSLMRQVHSVAMQGCSRVLAASADGFLAEESRKVALAWVLNTASTGKRGVPLWMPSFAAHMFPIARLDWLLKGSARIVMVGPTPRCLDGAIEEPPPCEGFCHTAITLANKLHTWNIKKDVKEFLFVEDHYLMYMTATNAEPSMLASSSNDVIKDILPYPFEPRLAKESNDDPPQYSEQAAQTGDISWIKRSTCLRELDFHDQVARHEFLRRCQHLERAEGLVDLLHVDSITQKGPHLRILYANKGHHMHVKFSNEVEANAWRESLERTIAFWRARRKTELICAATQLQDWTITPLLQNRAVVLSGQLFMKSRLYTSFKPFLVILTPCRLLIFRTRQDHAPAGDLARKTSALALHHKMFWAIPLQDMYVFTGQAVAQSIGVYNDQFTDPGNPGVRALPRTYEDGSISTEAELDRCFVLRGMKHTFAFLASSRSVRDRWSTAIRYAASNLDSEDPLLSANFDA